MKKNQKGMIDEKLIFYIIHYLPSPTTELLFVPEIFPGMDRAIYLDTDVIFMR